jgi:peptide/nickel transport system substrate-binding protein
MMPDRSRFVLAGLAGPALLALAACAAGGDSGGSGSGGARRGGTLTILSQAQEIDHLDPQRNYTGEDLAFASAYLNRTLTAYEVSRDDARAGSLVGDLATDTGKASDGGRTWAFTLRSGVKWQDGSDLTCADIKYGVSRTFAQKVITDGPSYAISLLDIPTEKDQDDNDAPTYKGPYETSGSNQAAFDEAVECSPDGGRITFHLNQAAADFNYTVSLAAFAPVPKAKDTGAKYDTSVVSSGPYQVAQYAKGQQLVLERNPSWSRGTDPYRPAYPDKIVVKFAVPAATVDQRLKTDAGDDRTAVAGQSLGTGTLTTVFGDSRFAKRRINELDPYVRYVTINAKKVPNVQHRQAILAAADRSAIRTIFGGSYAGDFADGLIKPNLAADYAPTGLWDSMLGAKVPETGNPELAKKLIKDSGQPMPTLDYQYAKDPDGDKAAAALQTGLARAGIRVNLVPLPPGNQFSAAIQDPTKVQELVSIGWAPDWLNASTIIPELFTPQGGFNLSQVDDKAFSAKAQAAKAEADRARQGQLWRELNKEAVQNAWVLPLRFSREQRLAGSGVGSATGDRGQVYLWAAYGSWSYPDLYVRR